MDLYYFVSLSFPELLWETTGLMPPENHILNIDIKHSAVAVEHNSPITYFLQEKEVT